MITLMMIIMMMVTDYTVHEEYEADQYTSIGKKGLQRIEQMAEIQRL